MLNIADDCCLGVIQALCESIGAETRSYPLLVNLKILHTLGIKYFHNNGSYM